MAFNITHVIENTLTEATSLPPIKLYREQFEDTSIVQGRFGKALQMNRLGRWGDSTMTSSFNSGAYMNLHLNEVNKHFTGDDDYTFIIWIRFDPKTNAFYNLTMSETPGSTGDIFTTGPEHDSYPWWKQFMRVYRQNMSVGGGLDNYNRHNTGEFANPQPQSAGIDFNQQVRQFAERVFEPVVYRKSGGNISLFVYDKRYSKNPSGSFTGETGGGGLRKLFLGHTGVSNVTNCKYDRLRIYNKALTDDECRTLLREQPSDIVGDQTPVSSWASHTTPMSNSAYTVGITFRATANMTVKAAQFRFNGDGSEVTFTVCKVRRDFTPIDGTIQTLGTVTPIGDNTYNFTFPSPIDLEWGEFIMIVADRDPTVQVGANRDFGYFTQLDIENSANGAIVDEIAELGNFLPLAGVRYVIDPTTKAQGVVANVKIGDAGGCPKNYTNDIAAYRTFKPYMDPSADSTHYEACRFDRLYAPDVTCGFTYSFR